MKFNAELFKTDVIPALDTPYVNEYSGAFYDVYEDEEGKFHMAEEDRDSLLERVYFYNTFFSKEKYPLYSNNSTDVYENQNAEDIVSQALGLPYPVITRKRKNGEVYVLPVTEIIDRIHFEKGIYKGHGILEDGDDLADDFLNGNHYSIIGAMNYLIAHGIFFQNLERIYYPYRDDPSYYPIRVDERKLPKEYLEEKETGDKLFFDFATQPLLINVENYTKTFSRIDSLSFTEKINLAFLPLEDVADPVERDLRISLRRYFFAICRDLIREYYKEEFNKTFLYRTVLDHDFEIRNTNFGDFYIGSVFNMATAKYYVIHKEDGNYSGNLVVSPYFCFEEDKKKLKLAFEGVKRYFDNHQDLCYFPQLFIKLMGLPYPAYEQMKFFDFRRGNVNQFLSLLYEEPRQLDYPFNGGLMLPLLVPGGLLVPFEKCRSSVPFYHNLELHNVFINEPAFFSECYVEDFVFFFSKGGSIHSFLQGDKKKCDRTFAINKQEDTPIFELLKSSPVENGYYKIIHDFYMTVNEGYSAIEAANMIGIDEVMEPRVFVMTMVYMLFNELVDVAVKNIENKTNAVAFNNLFPAVLLVEEGEMNADFYQLHRNFITSFEQNRFLFFADDQKYVEQIKKLSDRFSYHDEAILTSGFYGGDTHYVDLDREDLPDSLIGVPLFSFDPLYTEKPSLFDDVKLLSLLLEIPEVKYEYLFRKSLQNGIYLLGEDDMPRPFYITDKTLVPEKIKLMIDEEVISISYFGKVDTETCSFNDFFTKRDFHTLYLSTFMGKYVEGVLTPKKEEMYQSDFLLRYSGSLQKAWFDYLSGKTDSVFFGYYKTKTKEGKDIYVAPGISFSAFSYSDDISSFFFPKSDLPYMVQVIQKMVDYSSTTFQRTKPEIAVYSSGIPAIFYTKLLKMINRQEKINEETLMRYFTFIDEDIDESIVLNIKDHFFLEETNINNRYTSYQLRRALMKEGLYFYPQTDVHDLDLDANPKLNQFMAVPLYDSLDPARACCLSDIKGFVRQSLLPDTMFYESFVERMMNMCQNGENNKEWNLFYVKEFLLFSFYEDHEIILKWMDCLYHNFICLEAFNDNFYRPIVKKHSLFKDKGMPSSDIICYYVLLLLILIEKHILSTKVKEILG